MRVFVPATIDLLARWHSDGAVDADTAFAVTPALREFYASGDAEELEYAALSDAARSSLMLIAGARDAAPRRVVVALDTDDARPDAGLGRSAVRLDGPVRFDAVAAVHVDDADAEHTVRAAVAELERDRGGGEPIEPGASYALDDIDALELLWYATQEVPDLIDGS